MLRHATAQKIATEWYAGVMSGLYFFSSTGKYDIYYHLWYLKEVEGLLHPEYDLHPSELSKRSAMNLEKLKEFFLRQGDNAGIKTEWIKRPNYGYMLPKLHPDTNPQLVGQVDIPTYLK